MFWITDIKNVKDMRDHIIDFEFCSMAVLKIEACYTIFWDASQISGTDNPSEVIGGHHVAQSMASIWFWMLLTYLSSLTNVGSKSSFRFAPWWSGYYTWDKLLLIRSLSGKKIFSTCLGSAWRGTTTFFAFLKLSNLTCEIFLWFTTVGSCVGT